MATVSLKVGLPVDFPEVLTSPRQAPLSPAGADVLEFDESAFDPVVRASQVYCSGELLSAVQLSGLFEDSKEFVDMPMRHDPEVIIKAFRAIPRARRRDPATLDAFLKKHFHPPGEDLVVHEPVDHNSDPSILRLLDGHAHYQAWASELNAFWKQLVRRVHEGAEQHPQRYSILRRRFPVVVPGGRFRESYYWDSYWIVLGLLACDMTETARGLVQNLLDDVATFGFVPNGGRIYYLNRSQPPLLSEMVMALVEHSPNHIDESFVASALSVLEMEHAFWMTEGERAVRLYDTPTADRKASKTHTLNRYWTQADYPRPESYKEDLHHAGMASCARGFYSCVAAGAESGWDFTSRWIVQQPYGTYHLSGIATSSVIPVDLNSFLYRMERNMARLHDYLLQRQSQRAGPWSVPGDGRTVWVSPEAQHFAEAAERRAVAMERLLWDRDSGSWRDLWTDGRTHRFAKVRSASDFSPLWARVLENPALAGVAKERKEAVLKAFMHSGLVQAGGVQATDTETGEQWDKANAWSPVVQMCIEGLEGLGTEGAALARRLTRDWLRSNYLGWVNSGGNMFEKYNAAVPGQRGEGGEYYPQVGFGWTNGVVLHLLKTYAHDLNPNPEAR